MQCSRERVVRMIAWKDSMTGLTYRSKGTWTTECMEHLGGLVVEQLKSAEAEHAFTNSSDRRAFMFADSLARFWSFNYYHLLFPLRIRPVLDLEQQRDVVGWEDPFGQAQDGLIVDLDGIMDRYGDSAGVFRSTSLGSGGLPPILPLPVASGHDPSSDLLVDRLLLASLIVSTALRCHKLASESKPRSLEDGIVSAARLGILASPFIGYGAGENSGIRYIKKLLEGIPGALEIASSVGCDEELEMEAPPILRSLLPTIRKWLGGADSIELPPDIAAAKVYLYVAAPQRIQRYIFECPGLWEIRGASALLDASTDTIRDAVGSQDGPEAIVRSAASTIEFLTVTPEPFPGTSWEHFIKQGFYESAGELWIAVGRVEACLQEVFDKWRTISAAAWKDLQKDRNRSEVATSVVLPFEQRCDSCKLRAASCIDERVPDAGNEAWVCATCAKKIEHGRHARGKARELLELLGEEYADVFRWRGGKYVPPSTNDLIAENARHKLTGVLFGDGDDFGGVAQRIGTVSGAIQWSRRIDEVMPAATAVAMAVSLSEDLARGVLYKHLPFEVIALGGDDLSFITAGTITLRFGKPLLELIDHEFQVTPTDQHHEDSDLTPITFSFGSVLCDAKAPIRVVADWAESHAMNHAKKSKRGMSAAACSSTMVFIVTDSLDNLPADWQSYEAALTSTTRSRRKDVPPNNASELGLTIKAVLTPVDCHQLGFLLETADLLRQHQRIVRGLASAFHKSTPHAANLHYLYQKGRAEDTGGRAVFQLVERESEDRTSRWNLLFPGRSFPWEASLTGEEYEPFTELLGIIKATQTSKGGDGT